MVHALGVVVCVAVPLSVVEIVRRRRRLLSPTYRAVYMHGQREAPRPGKTYDRISTTRDLIAL